MISDQDIGFIKAQLKMPVVLCGMMGTGKSHVGRELAKVLGLEFKDSDSLVEERAGRSIADIFESYGEKKFRESEQKVILQLLEQPPQVISTGGGAVMTPGVMEAINQKSISVWLKTDIPHILERVSGGEKRPLLKEKDPEKVLADLMEKRVPYYARADIHIETTQGDVRKTLSSLTRALSAFLKKDNV